MFLCACNYLRMKCVCCSNVCLIKNLISSPEAGVFSLDETFIGLIMLAVSVAR